MLREVTTSFCQRPQIVLETVLEGLWGDRMDLLNDLFPSEEQLDEMLQGLPSNPIDPNLAIIEPLIPPSSTWKSESIQASSYDLSGFSEYARVVNALLSVFVDDRQLARGNIGMLRHFLILALSANELLQVPNAKSAMFRNKTSETVLRDIITRVQKTTAFLLSTSLEDDWHAMVVNALQQSGAQPTLDPVGQFVASIVSKARDGDTIRESLILHTVLQHVLSGATKEDADHWMLLARKLEKNGMPHTS